MSVIWRSTSIDVAPETGATGPIDLAGTILFFSVMVWSFKPAEMLAEGAATAAAAGSAEPSLPLERDTIASEAFRLAERARTATIGFGLALMAAALAHAGVFAWFHWLAHREMDRLGAAGSELTAISVEVVTPSQVAAAPGGTSGPGTNAHEDSVEAAPSAQPVLSPPPAAQAATDVPPLLTTDDPARFTVPQVKLPPPDTRVAEAAPKPEVQPVERQEPKPGHGHDPRKTPEREPQSANVGAAAQDAAAPSAAGSAASISSQVQPPNPPAASTGAMQAYAKSVVEALGRAAPRPNALQGVRGTVKLAFSVAVDGELETVRVVRSSGTPRVDELAIRAIKAARFPPPPPGMTLAQRTYEIPYVFR